MTYLPRRLRKPRLPRVILTSTRPISREAAAEVRRAWVAASKRSNMIVVDGTQFTVQVTR